MLVNIPINIPDIDEQEIREVTSVLSEKALTSASFEGGKRVRQFEDLLSNFVKSKFAIAVNSGTSALQASLYALDIKPNDEVLIPSFTFVATVEAIISKEIVLGSLKEEAKDARLSDLTAWDEMKLTGFSEALAAMPEPVEVERTFGKGKASEGEAVTETEREFAVTKDETGHIRLDVDMLKKQRGD